MMARSFSLPARLSRLPAWLCFALLSGLAAGGWPGFLPFLLLFLIGLAGGAIALALLTLILSLFNAGVRRAHGASAVSAAVNQGFLLLAPFTVLALLAELGLGWDAAAGFASAGIVSATGAAGAELLRLGGKRLPALLLPMLTGIAMSAAWLVVSSVAVVEVLALWS